MADIERRFTLQVPSSTENLAMIREFVVGVGGQAGLGESEIGKLELAVDEACANVIEHAYGHDVSKDVTVRASFDSDALHIAVIDEGQGFDPGGVTQSELDELVQQRKSGGLGMRLIRTLMDEVKYEIVPGQKNELHMMKKIR
ncbi:MAG: ATP-binding protein [Acidobacteria bacterium]|nr:ATP-binding protein [Acidobacteriota bacterium]